MEFQLHYLQFFYTHWGVPITFNYVMQFIALCWFLASALLLLNSRHRNCDSMKQTSNQSVIVASLVVCNNTRLSLWCTFFNKLHFVSVIPDVYKVLFALSGTLVAVCDKICGCCFQGTATASTLVWLSVWLWRLLLLLRLSSLLRVFCGSTSSSG